MHTSIFRQSQSRFAKIAREFRRLTKSFVRSSPTLILRHRYAWRKRPVDSGRAHFDRRDSRRTLDQSRIACTTQTDVVRKDRRVEHIVVTMNSVDAVKNRNAQTRLL